MYTKTDIMNHIAELGIKRDDTLLVHSSMKAIGEVENGADTVLDAFIEYMEPGLLILPTHTWSQIGVENPIYNPQTEPSCVGILTNLFLKRPGVIRSWHPTHSVAAIGKDAADYVSSEEASDTPCPRSGCWGKLYDRNAKILFLGCSLKSNTIIHGVEEWNEIPNRITDEHTLLQIVAPDGPIIDRPMRRHHAPVPNISGNYDKLEAPLLHYGIALKGRIGDAPSILCDVKSMVDLTSAYLLLNPDLFIDSTPIPVQWYNS